VLLTNLKFHRTLWDEFRLLPSDKGSDKSVITPVSCGWPVCNESSTALELVSLIGVMGPPVIVNMGPLKIEIMGPVADRNYRATRDRNYGASSQG
jgi:hypothetical protein